MILGAKIRGSIEAMMLALLGWGHTFDIVSGLETSGMPLNILTHSAITSSSDDDFSGMRAFLTSG